MNRESTTPPMQAVTCSDSASAKLEADGLVPIESRPRDNPQIVSGLRFQIGPNRLHLRDPQILSHAMHDGDVSHVALE
jgi:hypothetical protein